MKRIIKVKFVLYCHSPNGSSHTLSLWDNLNLMTSISPTSVLICCMPSKTEDYTGLLNLHMKQRLIVSVTQFALLFKLIQEGFKPCPNQHLWSTEFVEDLKTTVHWWLWKSVMAEWLEQAPQWYKMYCHDLEVTSSNPGRVELGVRSTSVLSHTRTKNISVS